MRIIGITGNSGSGKTSICKILIGMKQNETDQFYTMPSFILDADEIAREMAVPGKEYFNEIINIFGREILLSNGEINRAKLANIIFADSEKREALNSLTFNYVVKEIKRRVSLSKSETVIIDASLLIESKLNEICDIVISVVADEDVKMKRICLRDNIDEDTAKKRIEAQPKDDFYIKNSNYVIVNNGDCDLKEILDSIKEMLESEIIRNKEIVIIQDGKSRILQFKKLLEYSNVLSHAFTLRPLDFGSNDTYAQKKEEADNNYESVCELLNIDSKNIIRPYQTHTNNVKEVNEESRNI